MTDHTETADAGTEADSAAPTAPPDPLPPLPVEVTGKTSPLLLNCLDVRLNGVPMVTFAARIMLARPADGTARWLRVATDGTFEKASAMGVVTLQWKPETPPDIYVRAQIQRQQVLGRMAILCNVFGILSYEVGNQRHWLAHDIDELITCTDYGPESEEGVLQAHLQANGIVPTPNLKFDLEQIEDFDVSAFPVGCTQCGASLETAKTCSNPSETCRGKRLLMRMIAGYGVKPPPPIQRAN